MRHDHHQPLLTKRERAAPLRGAAPLTTRAASPEVRPMDSNSVDRLDEKPEEATRRISRDRAAAGQILGVLRHQSVGSMEPY